MGASVPSIHAIMTTLSPWATLTIPDLFRALDAIISKDISLVRSTRGHNQSSNPMVSPLAATRPSGFCNPPDESFVVG